MRHDRSGPPRAEYSWRIEGAIVVIEDKRTGRSVTNDAERVVADLVAAGVDVDRCGLMYKDSMGVWDGLATEGGRFVGFFPLQECDYRRAREALLDRMRRAWR